MANTNLFPIDDVVNMARVAGYSVFEIESFWTDELLAAMMGQYYEGSLEQVVNPAQSIRPEDVSVGAIFVEGATADIVSVLEQTADVTKSIASTIIEGVGAIPSLLKALPLIAIVAAGVGIYILTRNG